MRLRDLIYVIVLKTLISTTFPSYSIDFYSVSNAHLRIKSIMKEPNSKAAPRFGSASAPHTLHIITMHPWPK